VEGRGDDRGPRGDAERGVEPGRGGRARRPQREDQQRDRRGQREEAAVDRPLQPVVVRVVVPEVDVRRLHGRERALERPEPPSEDRARRDQRGRVAPDRQAAAPGFDVVPDREEPLAGRLRELERQQRQEDARPDRRRPARGAERAVAHEHDRRGREGGDEPRAGVREEQPHPEQRACAGGEQPYESRAAGGRDQTLPPGARALGDAAFLRQAQREAEGEGHRQVGREVIPVDERSRRRVEVVLLREREDVLVPREILG